MKWMKNDFSRDTQFNGQHTYICYPFIIFTCAISTSEVIMMDSVILPLYFFENVLVGAKHDHCRFYSVL